MKVVTRSHGIYTANKHFWEWPADDQGCWNWLCNEPALPQTIMEYVKDFNSVIMAGAHAGFYVKQYAQRFKLVYAIEPEPTNFFCLVQNVEESNVIKLQAALSDSVTMQQIGTLYADNSGGCSVGTIGLPCVTLSIDSLISKEPLNLIHLDVEGFEIFALKGGINTIMRDRPVIALETLNPYPWKECEEYLLSIGYKMENRLPHDSIYIPK